MFQLDSMRLNVHSTVEHILVLGAGASVEYGLPVWNDLALRIKEKVSKADNFQFKKQILSWVDKIGEKKMYSTLDECISNESVTREYHEDGVDIENRIFLVVKEIFNELYRDNPDGWIQKLNEKILQEPGLAQKLIFINYNYDHVLDHNFLDYQNLPVKHRRLKYKSQLQRLAGTIIGSLYPHGTLFAGAELRRPSNVQKFIKTMKTDDKELLDVISCYDCDGHDVDADFPTEKKLYLLGLGGGLKVNLSKLNFTLPISEINVTVHDKRNLNNVTEFLAEKFERSAQEINVFDNCLDLIERCF